jgi:Bacterial Ig domain
MNTEIAMRYRLPFVCASLLCATVALAQRPQPSPGVGNAVLLATNSVQIDRDSAVLSGDVVVNNATSGPVLGEAALSLDRNVTTPAGYKLAATSIDLDQGAVAGGNVYYNMLTNAGTIAGTQFTPLALPVFGTLPPALVRPAGTSDVVVANAGSLTLDEGAYGNVVVGIGATLRLSGGGYAFQSITVGSGGSLRYAAPTDVVVAGRADFAANSVVSPADGSGLTPAAMRIQVDGINGTDGALLSTPPAAHVGQGGKVFATLYATAGSLVLEQNVEGNGAFLGRDILVGRGSHLTLNSTFNQAPTADSQVVVTSGTSPLTITLTGADAEGSALTFSIVSGPSAGTLSAPVSTSPTSATVVYTPAAAGVEDSFTFRVTDSAGSTGDAVVKINPASADQPPNPTTVVATDSAAQTAQDVPATLLLRGTAPAGVALTFSIVANTGPSHGSLGAVTQGSEVPERSATVVYTPDAGYVGPDAFQFQACGVISSVTVCDTALFSITVGARLPDPPSLAHDVEVSTSANQAVLISLGGVSILTNSHRLAIRPTAAFLDPVEIAGNVADANGDGLGDNANALPGSTPVFMSAGVSQSGSAGSNGTVRMQFEWDMSSIAGSASALQSAVVILPTNRGTSDSLDTFFYWVAASGDGNLTNSDYQAPAERIPDAVMQVPQSMQVGADGTFSFSVLDQVRAAAANGYSFFAIQGRVDESVTGSARGLQVRTTASGNVGSNDIPMLSLATPGVTAPLLYRINSLPANGVLRDSANVLITAVPYDLPDAQVSYTPNTGFLGLDTFSFQASNGVTATSALARITVFVPTCQTDPHLCNDGR